MVQRLVAEAAAVSAAMLEQLLQRLQGPIQLPECLRVTGYLRRLAAFPGAWRCSLAARPLLTACWAALGACLPPTP